MQFTKSTSDRTWNGKDTYEGYDTRFDDIENFFCQECNTGLIDKED